ncbi:hypothetical protein N9A58_08360 [Opitutales bacterium]|jgi:hypothetical protein|nr:hypothetical protein [Opitutales bacterium]
MQDLIHQISANPLFSLVLALLAFLLIFLVLKSLFRIALFLVAIFALYAGYIYFFQEKFPIPEIEIDPNALNQFSEKVRGLIPADLNLSLLDSNFTRPALED